MARRSLRAFLITMIVAMMVGLREATGTAPPPPILTTERVEWLSPEPDGEPLYEVVGEVPDLTLDEAPAGPSLERNSLLTWTTAFLRRLGRR